MRDKIIAVVIGTLCIFGIFGFISVFVDVDSIWKILGISAPADFTHTDGRNGHTALLFIMFACVFSIVATAFASRQGIIQWCLDISLERTDTRVSTPVWEPFPGNYSSDIVYKRIAFEKIGETE